MKLFLGGSKTAKAKKTVIREKLGRAAEEHTEFLIGDCYGADTAMQKFLAEIDYPRVTVFTAHKEPRHNCGNWPVHTIDGILTGSFAAQRKKDAAMAKAADCGFMFWDGKSKGTFVNIIDLLGQGKPVCIFLTQKSKFVRLSSLHELLALLPESATGNSLITAQEKAALLNIFMPSTAMKSYLAAQPLTKNQISLLICGSPVPLKEKMKWMRRLAEKENLFSDILRESLALQDKSNAGRLAQEMIEGSFSHQAGQIKQALNELNSSTEAVFLLVETWHDDETNNQKTGTGIPFFDVEDALDYIRHDMASAGADYSDTCWYELEKWKLSTDIHTGKIFYAHTYSYYLIGEEVMYFEKRGKTKEPFMFLPESRRFAAGGQDLNLPIPFSAGNIVRIDCRPFESPRVAVLLEIGDNTDCCCVQALCRGENGVWTLGALKHGHISQNRDCFLSPLCRLEPYKEPLSPQDNLLQKIRDFVAGDEYRGKILWERLSRLSVCTDGDILLALTCEKSN